MKVSAGIQNYTSSIRSAIQMTMLNKAVNQDAQSVDKIMKSISQATGKGQNFDMKV